MTPLEIQLAEALRLVMDTDEITGTEVRYKCDCKFCLSIPKANEALAEFKSQQDQETKRVTY